MGGDDGLSCVQASASGRTISKIQNTPIPDATHTLHFQFLIYVHTAVNFATSYTTPPPSNSCLLYKSSTPTRTLYSYPNHAYLHSPVHARSRSLSSVLVDVALLAVAIYAITMCMCSQALRSASSLTSTIILRVCRLCSRRYLPLFLRTSVLLTRTPSPISLLSRPCRKSSFSFRLPTRSAKTAAELPETNF